MAIPSRILDRALVLSKLKQAAYGTELTEINLAAGKRFAPNNPVFGQPESSYYTDNNQTMRGHDWATTRTETMREYAEQLGFDGDSWLLAYMLVFALGKVTSTQPNAGGNPTCYKHVIKPLDPGTDGKDLPVTSVYAEMANTNNFKRRLMDLGIRECSIDFPPNAPVQISWTYQGSGKVGATLGVLGSTGIPAMSIMNKVFSNDMQVLYGPQGAPVDISTEIVPGSIRFGFTWNIDDDHARYPGSGLYRARNWVGTPQPSIEFQRLVDDAASTPQDDAVAGTVKELKIVVAGAQIGPGPEKHQLELRFLAVTPRPMRIGQTGDKTCYQYSIDKEMMRKEGANDVFTATVQNTETSYLV